MKQTAIVLAMCGVAACGGGSTSPGPVVTAPTISTTNTSVYIGQAVQFSATGSGTIRWGGDAPAVATVDATTGRITGLANGRVTIWAENDGGRTTRLMRVLPSFAGTWRGTYIVTNCEISGVFIEIDFCSLIPPGVPLLMSMSINQADDRVSGGVVTLGSTAGTLAAATVGDDGVVRSTASMTPLPDNPTRVNLESLRLESTAAGVIRGDYQQVWTVQGEPGAGRLTARFDTMNREAGGPSLQSIVPGNATTLQDLVRLMMSGR